MSERRHLRQDAMFIIHLTVAFKLIYFNGNPSLPLLNDRVEFPVVKNPNYFNNNSKGLEDSESLFKHPLNSNWKSENIFNISSLTILELSSATRVAIICNYMSPCSRPPAEMYQILKKRIARVSQFNAH